MWPKYRDPKTGQMVPFPAFGGMSQNISLGIADDGLMYIFVGGKPVGNGVKFSGGEVVTPGTDEPVVEEKTVRDIFPGIASLIDYKAAVADGDRYTIQDGITGETLYSITVSGEKTSFLMPHVNHVASDTTLSSAGEAFCQMDEFTFVQTTERDDGKVMPSDDFSVPIHRGGIGFCFSYTKSNGWNGLALRISAFPYVNTSDAVVDVTNTGSLDCGVNYNNLSYWKEGKTHPVTAYTFCKDGTIKCYFDGELLYTVAAPADFKSWPMERLSDVQNYWTSYLYNYGGNKDIIALVPGSVTPEQLNEYHEYLIRNESPSF